MEIEGLRAMIVGGAWGMARATAERIAAGGGKVAILDREGPAGPEAAAALGGTFHPCDILDFDGTELVIQEAVDAMGGLDAAVITAGGGIGARTLSGRGYEGHVFWDTEIFMLPFFLHTEPQRARTLLQYRHHTLEGARRRARGLGYQGACYAWESTVTGDDVTPRKIVLRSSGKEIPIFTGSQQIHVTADVAYATPSMSTSARLVGIGVPS